MDTLLAPLPETVDSRIRQMLEGGEAPAMQVASDLDPEGHYGAQWVVVTEKRVLVFSDGGNGEVVDIPVGEIVAARTEGLVGGGRLEVERRGAPTVSVPYSLTQALKFSEVARGIEQLRKGESLLVRMELDRTRCERCGLLLPEKNGICPACINRLATLGRIARYLAPYKGRAALLAVASILTTAAELLPPQVYRMIVDDVFVPTGGAGEMADRVSLLGLLVLALVGLRALTWSAEWLHGWTITWLGARVTADVRRVRLEDLRRQIGVVLQEPFLFSGTIAENIAYGKPGATFEEVARAAIAAEAHEFIVRKPDGYDMKVGEKGSRLSGGEKQRIAIARAILHDPKILILDEATSSLDTQTERKIQTAISRLVAGRTTFAIAHRLSTLRRADRLVVLDDGKVAEVGAHAELMAREGIFYRLVKTQQETSSMMAVGGGKDDPNQQGGQL